MIENVKQYILKNVGVQHKFVYKGVRNQVDEFEGTIKDLYPNIFTVILVDGSLKSFAYSDILVSNLKIC